MLFSNVSYYCTLWSWSIHKSTCIAVARLDFEGAQAIQTEELIVEEEVDYVLSVGEERIALQPKTLQDEPVRELILVRSVRLNS